MKSAALLSVACAVLALAAFARAEEPAAIPYADAPKFVGEEKTVEGTVTGTHLSKGSGNLYLNFGDYKKDLSVKIPKESIAKFPPDAAALYKGKKVRATGMIAKEKGKLRLTVSDPEGLKIAE